MRYINEDRPIGYNPAFAAAVLKKRKEAQAKSHVEFLLEEADKALEEIKAKKAVRIVDPISPIDQALIKIPKTEFERIMRRAIRVFNKAPKHIKGDSRQKDVVFARQFVFYWACRKTTLSLAQIGKMVGGKDHTTTLHGANAYRAKRARMGRNLPSAR